MLPNNYQCEGQMSLYDLDLWCGKMSQEHSLQAPPKEKTSESCSKKQPKLSNRMPLFLDLQRENGTIQGASWETGGRLLGEYTMHSFGESPSVENVSHLSQILEDMPHPKYCLSARACQGILDRSEKRGKPLPPILKEALIQQVIRLISGVSQDQTLIEIFCLEGNGSRNSHRGDGYKESETMYTLNTVEQHAVCVSQGDANKHNVDTDGELFTRDHEGAEI